MHDSPKPLTRPPLLTPSPTPPISRTNVSKRNEAPPPSKRQRFLSPSPTQPRRKPIPTSLPSAAKIPQNDDIIKERHATLIRLFNAWSSLAERYAKPIDEDDIVDIVTGQVVQDRGVISSWDKSKQGHFTNFKKRTPKVIEKTADSKVEEGQGEEKENDGDLDEDELDSFAVEDTDDDVHHEPDPSIEVAKEFLCSGMEQSVTASETDDLEGFMEAEMRRKELYGDDIHSSGDDSETTHSRLFRTSRQKGKERSKVIEEPTGVLESSSASLSPAPPNSTLFDEDLEAYEAQIRQFRASRLTAEASSRASESDDERYTLPRRNVVPFLSQPASPEKQDPGSRSSIHKSSSSPWSNPKKLTTSAQNSPPSHESILSPPHLPPSSSPLPSDDEDIEVYKVPPPLFRTPQSRRRIIIESDEENIPSKKHCTIRPCSVSITPLQLPYDSSSDDEIEIIGFGPYRSKMKGKAAQSEGDGSPDPERQSSHPPTVPPSSSPVSSDLDRDRSDSPPVFPPTSSSPVLLPQEDESDDELVGWRNLLLK